MDSPRVIPYNPSPTYSPKSGPTHVPNHGPTGSTSSLSFTPTSNIPSTPLTFVEPKRPSTISRGSSDDNTRKGSVSFLPHMRGGQSRSRSRRPMSDGGSNRRLSSPPPPAQFKPRVSFDTFDNRDAPDFSLTLNRKHRDYEYTKRSRTFLCGTDANDYSDTALEWLIDELVDDGDEVVCLRVVEKDSREAVKWAGGGYISGKEGRERAYRAEAQKMLTRIQEKNVEDKAINLVLEFSIGKVPDTIQHMIRIYEPAILVVGTRGRSLGGFQGLLPGSVSKYCLQHSPVPVIVVRPSSKREGKKKKRLRDPARRGYRDILDKSDDLVAGEGGHILDHRNRFSFVPGEGSGTLAELQRAEAEEEARRVAEAVGYKPQHDGAPLSRVTSARSDVSGRSGRSGRSGSMGSYRSNSPENMRSPATGSMKSPESRGPDSAADSASEAAYSDDDDDGGVFTYTAAQEKSLREARERALKAEEEEKERERELRGEKKPAEASQGGSGALDLLAALGGVDDSNKRPKKVRDSKGRKLAGGYPIP